VQEFHGEHLLRAVVLDEPDEDVSVKAQALELYDDGVVLRWALSGGYDESAEDRDSPWPKLEDDVGTTYRTLGGHGGGNPRYSGEWWIVPAVPVEAIRLEILGFEYSITASLD
jgi:hypothetical protein